MDWFRNVLGSVAPRHYRCPCCFCSQSRWRSGPKNARNCIFTADIILFILWNLLELLPTALGFKVMGAWGYLFLLHALAYAVPIGLAVLNLMRTSEHTRATTLVVHAKKYSIIRCGFVFFMLFMNVLMMVVGIVRWKGNFREMDQYKNKTDQQGNKLATQMGILYLFPGIAIPIFMLGYWKAFEHSADAILGPGLRITDADRGYIHSQNANQPAGQGQIMLSQVPADPQAQALQNQQTSLAEQALQNQQTLQNQQAQQAQQLQQLQELQVQQAQQQQLLLMQNQQLQAQALQLQSQNQALAAQQGFIQQQGYAQQPGYITPPVTELQASLAPSQDPFAKQA